MEDHEDITAPSLNSSNILASNKSKNSHCTLKDRGKSVECRSHHCKACTAVLIADGMAICCCPLALVSLLGLALLKIPCMMSKRCLGFRHRKGKEIINRRSYWMNEATLATSAHANNGDLIMRWNIHGDDRGGGGNDIVFEFGNRRELAEERKSICGEFDQSERFFSELYQLSQLGFGQVSFTGMQSYSKNN